MCVESLDESDPPETARDDRLVAKSQGESACILVNAPLVGVAPTRSKPHSVLRDGKSPFLAQGAMGFVPISLVPVALSPLSLCESV